MAGGAHNTQAFFLVVDGDGVLAYNYLNVKGIAVP